MPLQRRGFVLGVVLLTALVLAIFLFGYNLVVRRQNIRSHHEQIGEVAGILALSGANLLAEQIRDGGDGFIDAVAPGLKTSSTGDVPVPDPGGLVSKAKSEFNALLGTMTELYRRPVCRQMEITFDGIRQIAPDPTPDQMQAGRDPVEKTGNITINCVVEYQGLVRRATMRRRFRVVSMVPGPFARFTLFVPFTPAANSYNALGVVYNGKVDTGYTHPSPPGGLRLTGPLKIVNGTDSLSVSAPDTSADLANRGWIFLGPSHDSPPPGPVTLRISSGYLSAAGGLFMIANPIPDENGFRVVPPDNIEGPSPHFKVSKTTQIIQGLYQGFFTAEEDDKTGAIKRTPVAEKGFWHLPNPSDSAASWLMPFGETGTPSRTLMVGPVLAGFLKIFRLKDVAHPTSDPAYWQVLIKGRALADYDEAQKIISPPELASKVPLYKDVFLPEGGEASPKQGFANLARVSPVDYLRKSSFGGVAFNVLFDFMANPPKYPDFLAGSALLSGVASPRLVPKAGAMNGQDPKGVHPWKDDFAVFFTEGTSPDDTYFRGNLTSFAISEKNLLGRVSHVIDLSDSKSQKEEDLLFANSLFEPVNATKDAVHAGFWKPRRKGIFYVRRRNNPDGSLAMPGQESSGLFLDRNLIIIVDQGNVRIPNQIIANRVGDAPEKLLSLVAMNGNIILDTDREIDAYLVALKPGPSGGKGGGKVLCGPANAATKKMNVFGGVAAWEMGMYPDQKTDTTMTTFTGGGIIRYNPRFNPSLPVYRNAHEFLLEDTPTTVKIEGAGDE